MLTKISYGNKATVNTGNYENENPMYNVSVETEKKLTPKQIQAEFDRIKQIVDSNLAKDVDRIKNPKAPLPHHRITDGYVHVTTMLSPELLDIAPKWAESGTCFDIMFKEYIDEGLVTLFDDVDSEETKVLAQELFENFKKWEKEFGAYFEFKGHSFYVKNKEYKYVGEGDHYGMIIGGGLKDTDGDDVMVGSTFISDAKRTKKITKKLREEKYFPQMSAYDMGSNFDRVDYLIIISPFNPPIISKNKEQYWTTVVNKRKEFKEKYGV